MTNEESKNEVAVKEENLPADTGLFEGGDSGFEGLNASDFKIPFVRVAQKNSPQCDEKDSAFIEGLKPGMLFNTVTGQIYDNLRVIVIKAVPALIAWEPNNGPFVGRYERYEEDSIVDRVDGLKKWDSEGNDVKDTYEFYCVNADEPTDLFIIAFSSTAYKHGKSWLTRLNAITDGDDNVIGKMWAGIWGVGSTTETNNFGTWYTIGNTTKFERLINVEDKKKLVSSAQNKFKMSKTDYSIAGNEIASASSDSDDPEDQAF